MFGKKNKFKVGDKVKLISLDKEPYYNATNAPIWGGTHGEMHGIITDLCRCGYHVKFSDSDPLCFYEESLELLVEDTIKASISTRILNIDNLEKIINKIHEGIAEMKNFNLELEMDLNSSEDEYSEASKQSFKNGDKVRIINDRYFFTKKGMEGVVVRTGDYFVEVYFEVLNKKFLIDDKDLEKIESHCQCCYGIFCDAE